MGARVCVWLMHPFVRVARGQTACVSRQTACLSLFCLCFLECLLYWFFDSSFVGVNSCGVFEWTCDYLVGGRISSYRGDLSVFSFAK